MVSVVGWHRTACQKCQPPIGLPETIPTYLPIFARVQYTTPAGVLEALQAWESCPCIRGVAELPGATTPIQPLFLLSHIAAVTAADVIRVSRLATPLGY